MVALATEKGRGLVLRSSFGHGCVPKFERRQRVEKMKGRDPGDREVERGLDERGLDERGSKK